MGFKKDLFYRLLYKLSKLKTKTKYDEDGLNTFHIPTFLDDPIFIESYKLGQQTGSNYRSNIRWRVYMCCWFANHVKNLDGDFVECGVFKGFISRAVINYTNFGELSKKFYLLDTYNGIPEEYLSEKEHDLIYHKSQAKRYIDTYDDVKDTFKDFDNVIIIKGKVPNSLKEVKSEKIAYLSIDLNNAFPEIETIKYFWNKLVLGAVVILDDYCYSDIYITQRKEWDKFAVEKGIQILCLPTGQGLILKQ